MTGGGVVLQLLGRDDRTVTNEKHGLTAVEVGAVDGTVRGRVVGTHVRPENGAGS